ncbi:hypothetical protein [Fulvivirga sp.]|uniref:hypothetical protein n=1 Tax=Fulvivirga sp. TaxID=1931237 RepID=UPI0032F085F7
MKAKCFDIAEKTFQKVQDTFPELNMTIDYEDEHVDLSMVILEQNGLDFDIHLNLQNDDELHISTAFIWCQLFSAESSELVEFFFESVVGLISGEYRILQFVNKDKVYKSLLQKPNNENWETIYTDHGRFRMPWTRVDKNVIQNGKKSNLIEIYMKN